MKRKILGLLFLLHVFFMFYNLEKWGAFGWDQVDNAWVAMRMISQHEFPANGMVAKQNTGMHIGPLYYYYAAFFYFLTKLDPIASPIIAAVTSLINFGIIYFVVSKLFNYRVALLACFIYTFSSFVITTERVQWPVNFIAPFSLLILYFLHNVLIGNPKYLLHLGLVLGLSFHVHFTVIFYPIIILISIPFIRHNKKTILYALASVMVLSLFLLPQFLNSRINLYGSYVQDYYHGFHFTRVLQLTRDAFIKFESILKNPYIFIGSISFIFLPIFLAIHRTKLSLLIALWYVIPWFVFATYRGEISDYYFSINTYVSIMILSFLTLYIWDRKHITLRLVIVGFWGIWTIANVRTFFQTNETDFQKNRIEARTASETARIINFTEGDPLSYYYYYYMYIGKKWLPYQL